MMIVEQLQEGGFHAVSSFLELIHRYLNSITARIKKESTVQRFSDPSRSLHHAPQQADLSGVVQVMSSGASDQMIDLGRGLVQVHYRIA